MLLHVHNRAMRTNRSTKICKDDEHAHRKSWQQSTWRTRKGWKHRHKQMSDRFRTSSGSTHPMISTDKWSNQPRKTKLKGTWPRQMTHIHPGECKTRNLQATLRFWIPKNQKPPLVEVCYPQTSATLLWNLALDFWHVEHARWLAVPGHGFQEKSGMTQL